MKSLNLLFVLFACPFLMFGQLKADSNGDTYASKNIYIGNTSNEHYPNTTSNNFGVTEVSCFYNAISPAPTILTPFERPYDYNSCEHKSVKSTLRSNAAKLSLAAQTCVNNFSNLTVTSNTTVTGCSTLTVNNVTVNSSAKLTIISGGEVILTEFEVKSGAQLDLH